MGDFLKSVSAWVQNRVDEVSKGFDAFGKTARTVVGSPEQAKEASEFSLHHARLQVLTTGNPSSMGDMAHSYLFMRQMQENSRISAFAFPPTLRIGANSPATGAPATTALSGGAQMCVDPSASPQIDPQTLTCH